MSFKILNQPLAPILAVLNLESLYPHLGRSLEILVTVVKEKSLPGNHSTIGKHLAIYLLAGF